MIIQILPHIHSYPIYSFICDFSQKAKDHLLLIARMQLPPVTLPISDDLDDNHSEPFTDTLADDTTAVYSEGQQMSKSH